LTKDEYYTFIEACSTPNESNCVHLKIPFTARKGGTVFEGCLPIEIMAERGKDSLAFGPMRPVGLIDPTQANGLMRGSIAADNLAGNFIIWLAFRQP